jgi:hypothetical protein
MTDAPALGYVEIVKPDASPRDMDAIREHLPEIQDAIAAGKLVFVVEGMTLRWHPFGIDAERARHEVELRAAFLRGEEFANARHAALVEAVKELPMDWDKTWCFTCHDGRPCAHDALLALIEEARK